jgi:hypothetical protein
MIFVDFLRPKYLFFLCLQLRDILGGEICEIVRNPAQMLIQVGETFVIRAARGGESRGLVRVARERVGGCCRGSGREEKWRNGALRAVTWIPTIAG